MCRGDGDFPDSVDRFENSNPGAAASAFSLRGVPAAPAERGLPARADDRREVLQALVDGLDEDYLPATIGDD